MLKVTGPCNGHQHSNFLLLRTLLATTSRGLEAKSGEMEWNSAACCAMVYPHASDTSSTYSTAARRCASAVMLCDSQDIKYYQKRVDLVLFLHASDTSSTYSTAARRCASAMMLCGDLTNKDDQQVELHQHVPDTYSTAARRCASAVARSGGDRLELCHNQVLSASGGVKTCPAPTALPPAAPPWPSRS